MGILKSMKYFECSPGRCNWLKQMPEYDNSSTGGLRFRRPVSKHRFNPGRELRTVNPGLSLLSCHHGGKMSPKTYGLGIRRSFADNCYRWFESDAAEVRELDFQYKSESTSSQLPNTNCSSPSKMT